MLDIQKLTKQEFVEKCASGTLRKAVKLGFAHKDLYVDERISYEFGYEFMRAPASRVLYGPPVVEGDNHFVTEAIWHIERYLTLKTTETEQFECSYINYENAEGSIIEGIGIKVLASSSSLYVDGFEIFAIVGVWDKPNNCWLKTSNPF